MEYESNVIEIIFEKLHFIVLCVRVEADTFILTKELLENVLYEFISNVLLHILHPLLTSPGGTSLEPSLVLNAGHLNLAQLWYFSEMEKEKYALHTWTLQVTGT